ncbi:ATP cone domain-containing protein [Natronogracilivirga saccharolytica]|uniref:Restriction endonuclease n=1 Tax=Natronogracilivirga saccharolytica TaxID=2812953 RepID=A0A8J7RKT0_9BACT|nr:ATP cone domain-containing protein [Natronogracilivirga saccharolytica]MBP3193102.1 restriction endonuclease [Natronogracilivirga saccharolytica]
MNSSPEIRITKASGELVPFSEKKLRQSLERAGAAEPQISAVVDDVRDQLYHGIGTGKIYRKAYDLLRKKSYANAARYKLKKAIMELGPSGYPFEQFVAAILEQQGFQTSVGKVIKGKCVTHEVDVVAQKNGKLIMAECKFHNRPGVKCDVKVPLYIDSRFRDVMNGSFNGSYSDHEGWIVTNTRFTDDAISYGTCAGLVMLGWDYPKKSSLKKRIGLAGLHPLTCLSSLQQKEKAFLLEKGVVLCRRVRENEYLLRELGLSDTRIKKVISECDELVNELDVPPE